MATGARRKQSGLFVGSVLAIVVIMAVAAIEAMRL
jgi:hypothetical protein